MSDPSNRADDEYDDFIHEEDIVDVIEIDDNAGSVIVYCCG